jgi:hypothetical protein
MGFTSAVPFPKYILFERHAIYLHTKRERPAERGKIGEAGEKGCWFWWLDEKICW